MVSWKEFQGVISIVRNPAINVLTESGIILTISGIKFLRNIPFFDGTLGNTWARIRTERKHQTLQTKI
jgi:hypothetical protein